VEACRLIDQPVGLGKGLDVVGGLGSSQTHLPIPIHDHPEELASVPRVMQRLGQDTLDRWEGHLIDTGKTPEDRHDQQKGCHPGGGWIARQAGNEVPLRLGPEERLARLHGDWAFVDRGPDPSQGRADQIRLADRSPTGGDQQIHRREGFPERRIQPVRIIGDTGQEPNLGTEGGKQPLQHRRITIDNLGWSGGISDRDQLTACRQNSDPGTPDHPDGLDAGGGEQRHTPWTDAMTRLQENLAFGEILTAETDELPRPHRTQKSDHCRFRRG